MRLTVDALGGRDRLHSSSVSWTRESRHDLGADGIVRELEPDSRGKDALCFIIHAEQVVSHILEEHFSLLFSYN